MDDAAILEVLREDGPLSSVEVAAAMDESVRAANHRLRELLDAGDVEATPLGNAILWSVPAGHHDSGRGVVGNSAADPD